MNNLNPINPKQKAISRGLVVHLISLRRAKTVQNWPHSWYRQGSAAYLTLCPTHVQANVKAEIHDLEAMSETQSRAWSGATIEAHRASL